MPMEALINTQDEVNMLGGILFGHKKEQSAERGYHTQTVKIRVWQKELLLE